MTGPSSRGTRQPGGTRPLVAGDRLTATRTVAADESRPARTGGTNRLVTLETAYVDAMGEVAVRQREVLIERDTA